jgi:hypothetical protein
MDQEAEFQETPRNGGQRGTSGLPGPLRRFAIGSMRSVRPTSLTWARWDGFWWSWLLMRSFSVR